MAHPELVVIAVVVAAVVAVILYYRSRETTPILPPIDNIQSPLSQNAIRRFRTTGGAGICPSISEYYDPIKGYCLRRPKMVYGAEYGTGPCFFDSDCAKGGVCDRFGECQCGPGFSWPGMPTLVPATTRPWTGS